MGLGRGKGKGERGKGKGERGKGKDILGSIDPLYDMILYHIISYLLLYECETVMLGALPWLGLPWGPYVGGLTLGDRTFN